MYYDRWDFGEPSNSIVYGKLSEDETIQTSEAKLEYSTYPYETTPPTTYPYYTTTYGPRTENCLAMIPRIHRWNDIDCYASYYEELKRPICQIFE